MTKQGKLLPVCLVCGQVPANGIQDGVVVTGNFICLNCEKDLTSVRQEDSKYLYYVAKLKKLWS